MKAIVHAKAVLPAGILENATILMEGERITAVGQNLEIPAGTDILDAENMYVGPGFVDIHVHGSGPDNRSFESEPAEVAAYHLKHGTTSICGYLGYGLKKGPLLECTKLIQKAIDEGKAPTIMGVGYEGPYVNPNQGAAVWLNDRKGPDPDEYEALWEATHGNIVQWMYAPEQDEDGKFAAFLREKGIPAAIGHSNASPEEVRRAVDRGATIVTHLYDAMGCWMGDDSVNITGIIQDTMAVGCLICPELTYEIIPDSKGMHVRGTNMKLVYQMAGPHRICIITDCTTRDYDPTDYPEDHIRSAIDLNFNEQAELSGSALTMDQAFRNFMMHTGATVQETFLMAATTPARVVKAKDVGSIVAGKLANFVFLDDNCMLQKVIFRGEVVA